MIIFRRELDYKWDCKNKNIRKASLAESNSPPEEGKNEQNHLGANGDESIPQYPEMLDEAGLENFLVQEAPEFTNSLSEIEKDKQLSASEIVLTDAEQELAEEVDAWKSAKGIKKIIFKVFPFAPRVSLKIKKIKYKAFIFSRSIWVRIKNFSYFLATDGKKKIFDFLKTKISDLFGKLSSLLKAFKAKPLKVKLFAFSLVLFGAFTLFFIYKAVTQGVINRNNQLFIGSLAEVSDHRYSYDPETETEFFYDNLKANQNLLLIRKLFVNLKVSEKSGPNPMGAFEFFVEGAAPEVIIEIKDREGAIVDGMQRTLEEFTFESLESPEGKEVMLEKLKKQINSSLTTGVIKKVLIKNVVLKP